MFTACLESGTWCVFLIFILSAGITQRGSEESISNSFQSAKRNSWVHTKVNIMNFIASNVVGVAALSAFIFFRNSGNAEIGREFWDFGCGLVVFAEGL